MTLLKSFKDHAQSREMFFKGRQSNKNIINLKVYEIEITWRAINVTWKGLTRVAKPEGHVHEFEKAERGYNSRFWYDLRSNRNLIKRFMKIKRRKVLLTVKVISAIMDMSSRILIRDRGGVEAPIITTPSPRVNFFNYIWRGLAQGLLEGRQIPASIQTLNSVFAAFSLSTASLRDRSETGGPDVKI